MLKSYCSLFLLVGLIGLSGVRVQAQSGPAVQIFTSTISGGTKILPLERLPVKVSVTLNAGCDTNVGTSNANERNSFFSSLGVGLSYPFGNERTRGSFSTNASVTYFENGASGGFNYDPNLALAFSLAHDVSERLLLSASVYARYGIEPDFVTGLGENRRNGNFFNSSNSFSASYQWYERFSTVTSYSLTILKYEDTFIGQFLDRAEHGFSQQFRFVVLPFTTAVGEYRLGLARYSTNGQDSTSHFLLGGVDHTLGPHTLVSFRAGAEFRSSEQDASDSVSPYVSGNLSYSIGERTSVSWNAQYSKSESNSIAASSSSQFTTGLQMTYGITARITGTLAGYYRNSSSEGRVIFIFRQPSFSEDTFDLGADFNYAILPRLSANAGIHYTSVSSDFGGREYGRARYFCGINYSF